MQRNGLTSLHVSSAKINSFFGRVLLRQLADQVGLSAAIFLETKSISAAIPHAITDEITRSL